MLWLTLCILLYNTKYSSRFYLQYAHSHKIIINQLETMEMFCIWFSVQCFFSSLLGSSFACFVLTKKENLHSTDSHNILSRMFIDAKHYDLTGFSHFTNNYNMDKALCLFSPFFYSLIFLLWIYWKFRFIAVIVSVFFHPFHLAKILRIEYNQFLTDWESKEKNDWNPRMRFSGNICYP